MQQPPISCDYLITADHILTQDAQRRQLTNGAIAVGDGRILAVGTAAELASCRCAERIDLGRALLMPGLVNAHTHVSMTFFRGLADDMPLMEWLTEHIFPREKRLSPEIVELGALLGCAEMLRTGVTAFADMYIIEESVARAVDACGMRFLMGEGVFAFSSPAYADKPSPLDLVREQARRYAAHPRIRVAVMPHAVYTTTPELLQECRELADELDLSMHMHLSETQAEVDACLKANGKRPIAYCDELGLLRPNICLAHAVAVNEEELDLLAERKVHIAHNPRSNMKLASGIAPVPGMLARGMLPGLGTDGAASNNALNMFAEMSACALLHKVDRMDPTVCPAGTVLDMATRGSADAIAWPECGRLEPGAMADVIALDLDSPNMQPLYTPASQLAYAASGHEVRFTMVHGNVLYRDGEYKTIDYPQLLRDVAKLKQWALEE